MHITVTAFAALKDALGAGRLVLELPEGATAGDLRDRIARDHPRWADLVAACRLARGTAFVDEDLPLAEGMEIALIPPVSGGAPEPGERSAFPEVLLTDDPLDREAIRRALARGAVGAVVVFEGTVRSPSEGREVRHLEYEAYGEMARAQMARILDEARKRWPDAACILHHRLGRVEVGEASVVAAAAAPHRAEAFAACRHLIERLKAEVPIWKKEVFADGSVWAGAPGECRGHGEDEGKPAEGGGEPAGRGTGGRRVEPPEGKPEGGGEPAGDRRAP